MMNEQRVKVSTTECFSDRYYEESETKIFTKGADRKNNPNRLDRLDIFDPPSGKYRLQYAYFG